MTVYVLTINYSGWEEPGANGCVVHVFDSEEKAIDYMEEAVKQEIEEGKEYGRKFHENARFPKYVFLADQHSEYAEFEVVSQEVM